MQQLAQIEECEQFENTISMFCSQNNMLLDAQQSSGRIANQANVLQNQQRGETEGIIRRNVSEGKMTMGTIKDARGVCLEAANKCGQKCREKAIEYAQNPKTREKAQRMEQINQRCQQEAQSTEQKAEAAQADLSGILEGLMALLQALGLGDDDKDPGLADLDKSDDPCEGQYADVLIECTGQSGPTASRAGLNGAVGGDGRGGLNSDGLFQSSEQGEPGGARGGGNNSGGPGGGMPMMGAGMGMPLNGLGSGGADGNGDSGSGLDSDIHRGYMGGGGGSGGGGSGGGGSSLGSSGGFGKSSLGSDKLASGLDRKLNKLTKGGPNRAPASKDGKNGPFDDNWSVVNKAYKKNASSMYHQK